MRLAERYVIHVCDTHWGELPETVVVAGPYETVEDATAALEGAGWVVKRGEPMRWRPAGWGPLFHAEIFATGELPERGTVPVLADVAESRPALAHYLWPPAWVGTDPVEPGDVVDPTELSQVVLTAELPDGACLRVFRDGMLVFDFGSWAAPVDLEDFDAAEQYQTRCVRLMNAHLACLCDRAEGFLTPTVLTLARVMRVEFADGRLLVAGGRESTATAELYFAREARLEWNDWRLRRGLGALSENAVRGSVALLRELLNRPNQDKALLRAELLHRSAAAYHDHDYSAALVHAWTAAEGLLGDLFAAFLDEEENRPNDGPAKFINDRRRKFLEGSEVTARLTAEILSLLDRLPFGLYRDARESAKARNNWLHSSIEATHEVADQAIHTAEGLFALVEGIDLRMPLSRSLHLL